MASPDLTLLHRAPGGLFEAPRYSASRGLVFSDARMGGLFALSPAGEVETVIAHRRGIGGLALHEDEGFVVTGRNVALKAADVDGVAPPTTVLLDTAQCPNASGFNDLAVDLAGRIYVGTHAVGALESHEANPNDPPPLSGDLYLIDVDGSHRIAAEDIWLPNGAAVSPDGSFLYVGDSGRKVVFRFDLDSDTGELRNRLPLIEVDPGVPDGLTVAEDGSIWVAQPHSGVIGRYTSDGALMESWSTPDPMVTSLCFGGPDDRQLFITTGATDATGTAAVYVGESDVAGAPVPLARVVAAVD
jgi:xylono-1,5-lactonase